MVRAGLVALGLAGASGCSLILDWSPGAIPIDAPFDAPYSREDCAYKEPNDTAAAAALITPDDTGPAGICPKDPPDYDFYRFTVPAGTTQVSVRVTFAGANGDMDVRIMDLAGATTIGESRGLGDEEAVVCPGSSPTCPMLAAGDYVLEVFAGKRNAVNRYSFELKLEP